LVIVVITGTPAQAQPAKSYMYLMLRHGHAKRMCDEVTVNGCFDGIPAYTSDSKTLKSVSIADQVACQHFALCTHALSVGLILVGGIESVSESVIVAASTLAVP